MSISSKRRYPGSWILPFEFKGPDPSCTITMIKHIGNKTMAILIRELKGRPVNQRCQKQCYYCKDLWNIIWNPSWKQNETWKTALLISVSSDNFGHLRRNKCVFTSNCTYPVKAIVFLFYKNITREQMHWITVASWIVIYPYHL